MTAVTAPRRLIVAADGGSRGNPGPAGFGAVVRDAGTGRVLTEVSESIGVATNNVAEYSGLIAGLRAAAAIDPGAAVDVRMDSKLVVEQMSGRWQVKHPDIRPLAAAAAELTRGFAAVSYTWVPRADNSHADRLANAAMDAAEGRRRDASSTMARSGGRTSPAPQRRQVGEQVRGGGHDPTPVLRSVSRSATVPEPARQPPAEATGPADAAPGAAARGERAGATGATESGWLPAQQQPTITLLLRHGQTALSAERRFAGVGDAPLTEAGLEQAKLVGERLAARGGIDAVVTSPLRRARQTAQQVAAATGAPLVTEDGFREADFGAWEGLTFAEAQRRWPAEVAAWLADPAVAPPGGESFAAVADRVRVTLRRVLAGHPRQTVLVVSHVTPIKTLLVDALLAPPAALYRIHLDVACLNRIDWYPDGPAVVRSLNDTAHLAQCLP